MQLIMVKLPLFTTYIQLQCKLAPLLMFYDCKRYSFTEWHSTLPIHTHVDPNVRTKEGLTPLHFAACHLPRTFTEATSAIDAQSTSREVIGMLLQEVQERVENQNIAFVTQDNQGITPLHMACSRGNVPAVQELLKYMKGMH